MNCAVRAGFAQPNPAICAYSFQTHNASLAKCTPAALAAHIAKLRARVFKLRHPPRLSTGSARITWFLDHKSATQKTARCATSGHPGGSDVRRSSALRTGDALRR
jgi:hypothetical protein